jgi:hypothetical protein
LKDAFEHQISECIQGGPLIHKFAFGHASFHLIHHGWFWEEECTLPECKDIGVGCDKVIMDSLLERMPDFQFLPFQNTLVPIIIQRMRLNVSTRQNNS